MRRRIGFCAVILAVLVMVGCGNEQNTTVDVGKDVSEISASKKTESLIDSIREGDSRDDVIAKLGIPTSSEESKGNSGYKTIVDNYDLEGVAYWYVFVYVDDGSTTKLMSKSESYPPK